MYNRLIHHYVSSFCKFSVKNTINLVFSKFHIKDTANITVLLFIKPISMYHNSYFNRVFIVRFSGIFSARDFTVNLRENF